MGRFLTDFISYTFLYVISGEGYAHIVIINHFLEENKAADAMKGLKSAAGWLRREIGHALNLRYTPQIMWALDDSIVYGAKLLELINSLEVSDDDGTDEA